MVIDLKKIPLLPILIVFQYGLTYVFDVSQFLILVKHIVLLICIKEIKSSLD